MRSGDPRGIIEESTTEHRTEHRTAEGSAEAVGGDPSDGSAFRRLVAQRSDLLREEWLRWLVSRTGTPDGEITDLLREFVAVLVELLEAGLGPHRNDVEPLWREAATLYGSVSAMRGLAAGEVIEEFQFLRAALIRHIFDGGVAVSGSRAALREILQLNRWVDRGVTEASVGHTDALFFALFRGDGVPEALTDELVAEVRDQLGAIRSDLAAVGPARPH